jgi:hypothetical protein
LTDHPRLAVAASAAYPDLRPDWPLLQSALADLGIVATTAIWTEPTVQWKDFDLVVANGAWDNIHRTAEFLAWAEAVATTTRFVNHPALLRWNIDKHYLSVLQAHSVPIVPTIFIDPNTATIQLPDDEVVIKPTVSGGGFETARYTPADHEHALAHIERLQAAGRTVMLQPYQGAVDRDGETALIYVGGRFCHAINKGPLLLPGAGVQGDLWHHERITSVAPSDDQRGTAQAALSVAEDLFGPTAYARVDLVSLSDGTPAVLELEALDPALFFECYPAGATTFAAVLAAELSS